MIRYTLIAALFLISFAASAQQEGFKGEPFIEVSGIAETEIDPNQITLMIRLREFEENRNKTSLEKIDQDFQSAMKAAGIDKKRLTLADAGSKLSKLGKKEKDAFREKTYEIVLTSAAELEKLLEKLEPVKVDLVSVTRVHHSEMEKFKLDVKVKALQTAKSKAEILARSIGSDIGKPLMIREWDHEPVYPMLQSNVAFKSAGQFELQEEDSQTSFKKIKLRAQVSAQFEIK